MIYLKKMATAGGVSLLLSTALGLYGAPALAADSRVMNISAALSAALDHDPELRIAYMTFQADKEELALAKGKLLPQVQLSAGYSYEDSDNIYTDPDSSYYDSNRERSSGTLNDHYWQLSMSQPVYDMARYRDYQGKTSFVNAAQYRYQQEEQELTYRLSERYLAVLLSAQQVFLNQQKLSTLEANLEQVEREFSLGVGDQLNVLEVKSHRDLARSDLLQAESDLSAAKTLLNNMTGVAISLPQSWITNGHKVNYQLPVQDEAFWLDQVNNSYRVREIQASIDLAEKTIEARQAGHYPTVDFSLSYIDRTSEDEVRERKDLTAKLEFRLPLYQGGQTEAGIRQSSARLGLENARGDHILSTTEQQIRLAYSQVSSLGERLAALGESRESGQRYLDAAKRGQALNLRSQVEVLDAQTRLVDTQLRFAETLNEYLLANLRLYLETGQLDKDKLVTYDQLFDQVKVAQE